MLLKNKRGWGPRASNHGSLHGLFPFGEDASALRNTGIAETITGRCSTLHLLHLQRQSLQIRNTFAAFIPKLKTLSNSIIDCHDLTSFMTIAISP